MIKREEYIRKIKVLCVIAETEESNITSKRVLEKVGFTLTGRKGEEGSIFVCKNNKK